MIYLISYVELRQVQLLHFLWGYGRLIARSGFAYSRPTFQRLLSCISHIYFTFLFALTKVGKKPPENIPF